MERERQRRAKTEGEVWRIVNRERGKRVKGNEEITMEMWKEYFMGGLGGVEGKVVRGSKEGRGGQEEREISREEVRRAIGKLKDGKAVGIDELSNEVWRYGGEKMGDWVREMCNKVWRREGWPEQWKEGIIVPIVKKGKGVV